MERTKVMASFIMLGVLVLSFLASLIVAAASEGFWPTVGWSAACYGCAAGIKIIWRYLGI